MTINHRIQKLREAMRAHHIDAYIIPSSDPHQSEYVAGHWASRQWISGFTGSAGLAIVTLQHAGLWTDSRYWLQAETELRDTAWVLHRQEGGTLPEHITWLQANLPPGSTLGIDGALFSAGQWRFLRKQLQKYSIEIEDKFDLIAEIRPDRPALPAGMIFEYDLQFAGESRADKLRHVREQMRAQAADFHLVTTLDDIAWTLNLRGTDIPFNPLVISHLIIGLEMSWLFIQPEKVPDEIKRALNEDGVVVQPYEQITSFLQKITAPILIDDHSVNLQLYRAIPEAWRLQGETIPLQLKAVKNATEIAQLRTAMCKDGVALLRFFRWLEQALTEAPVTEYEAGRQLHAFRQAQGDYFGESFSAIVGYNSNGAIVHYRPDEQDSAVLRAEGILLLDSGGQYLQGTTDITRTVALGPPNTEQQLHYTLVLKGHIALAMARFPAGTTGVQLDTLARQFLWQQGLNFGHGTGHGVGFFLCVHEPPQGFTSNPAHQRSRTALQPGMLTSNEPGFYQTGAYGIRIENLVLCVPTHETVYGAFLQFETLSLFPIDTQLIDSSLLTGAERQWLNDYHQKVLQNLGPYLDSAETAWLQTRCAAI